MKNDKKVQVEKIPVASEVIAETPEERELLINWREAKTLLGTRDGDNWLRGAEKLDRCHNIIGRTGDHLPKEVTSDERIEIGRLTLRK